ncbi:MAG: DsrH/TusB family sulfur metabolism protein [Candidatus Hodarchaeota archaeon]
MNNKNSIVYLYGFSPTLSVKSNMLLKIIKEQLETNTEINVVLIHDGVIGTSMKGETPKFLVELLRLPVNAYALSSDIKARGIDPNNLINHIKGIEYEDLVDILVNTQKIVSWV